LNSRTQWGNQKFLAAKCSTAGLPDRGRLEEQRLAEIKTELERQRLQDDGKSRPMIIEADRTDERWD
jgi:hypothetical protein